MIAVETLVASPGLVYIAVSAKPSVFNGWLKLSSVPFGFKVAPPPIIVEVEIARLLTTSLKA